MSLTPSEKRLLIQIGRTFLKNGNDNVASLAAAIVSCEVELHQPTADHVAAAVRSMATRPDSPSGQHDETCVCFFCRG